MNGMTAFLVAVSGTSLICYLMMGRVQKRKSRRQGTGGDASSMGSGDNAGGGWNLPSWFGSESPASDSCTSTSDSGADGGGGGDGGGGD